MPLPHPADTQAAELDRLAHLVRRLRPDGRNPEPFYEARSEAVAGLVALSRRLGYAPLPAAPRPAPPVAPPITAPAPKPRVIVVHGYPGLCRRCRRPFEAVQPTKRFCSSPCKQAAYRQRLRATGAAAAGPVPDHPASP
jgi:hypothetical protein